MVKWSRSFLGRVPMFVRTAGGVAARRSANVMFRAGWPRGAQPAAIRPRLLPASASFSTETVPNSPEGRRFPSSAAPRAGAPCHAHSHQ